MRKYKVLFLTGSLTDQQTIISSPYYYREGQRVSSKDGLFRVISCVN